MGFLEGAGFEKISHKEAGIFHKKDDREGACEVFQSFCIGGFFSLFGICQAHEHHLGIDALFLDYFVDALVLGLEQNPGFCLNADIGKQRLQIFVVLGVHDKRNYSAKPGCIQFGDGIPIPQVVELRG